MLGKKSGQVDVFTSMIYDKLVPKNHLLVKVDEVIDFSFVYDIVQESYSEIGRQSEDPVVMYKLCLLEYLYRLSDRQVVERALTDVAFRWFLRLNLDDKVPDDTTISTFRTNRLGEKKADELFNAVVALCIEKELIKSKRYIIDTTDVAANVNYPTDKRMLCDAFRRVTRELKRFDADFAERSLKEFEHEIEAEHNKADKVSIEIYCKIARKYVEEIYIKKYEQLRENKKSHNAFVTLWRIIEQYSDPKSTDKIISCIDPDARVAYKTKKKKKRGYKNHIIVDEDSEIIIASVQTPFNVHDCEKLTELVEKPEEYFELKPEEVSADKAYGTIENRAALKDKGITANIAFYNNSNVKYNKFDIKQFDIAEDLKSAKCPNGCTSIENKLSKNGKLVKLKFSQDACNHCPLRQQCLPRVNLEKGYGRTIEVALRYDAFIRDMNRNKTEEFKKAYDRRYIVERRFAALVRNHGMRRCRYLRMMGAKIHITFANMACNIVRMVNLLHNENHPSVSMT